MNLPLILIFEGDNNIVIADIARHTTKRRRTLFFILVREKRSIIVKIKEHQADLDNVRIQIIIDSTVKIHNVILSHNRALVINIPKETGIIKFA
jgi:hypothetical protein